MNINKNKGKMNVFLVFMRFVFVIKILLLLFFVLYWDIRYKFVKRYEMEV